ncbi:hypothetical protein [Sorangium sp. So ce341]|uniref:hypothetical protein n=1 Tax=Sorangium sp. So ce341 TaxID=3133302 RepID=UPI003F63F408
MVFVVAEEHADLQRRRLERLGPDLLAALGGEDLDVAFRRPAVDGQGLFLGVDDPGVRNLVPR